MVPSEVLAKLPAAVAAQSGFRGAGSGPLNPLLGKVAKCYGIRKRGRNYSDQEWNRILDCLDRDYPGWRGYRVPETEGSRHV